MKANNKKFISDSIITLTRQVMNIGIGILLLVVLTRFLGPVDQGKYSLVTLLPMMLMMFISIGINTSTIYFVSKNKFLLETVLKTNILVGILLSLVAVVAGLMVIVFFSEALFEGVEISLLYMVLFSIPFIFLKEFLQTIFHGLQDFKSYNTLMIINQFAILGFISLFIIVLDYGLVGAIIGFVLGNITTVFVILYLLLKKKQLRLSSGQFSRPYLKESVDYGFKAYVSNLATFLNYRLDVFIVGYFLSPASVGIYTVAVNVGERITMVSTAISSVLFPKIASEDTEEARNRLTSIVSRNVLLISVLASIALLVVSDFVIGLFFGREYIQSSDVLKIIMIGIIFLSVEKIFSNDIAGRGKPEINMYTSIFNVIMNVGLNILLIPQFGIMGSAYATTITYFVSFIIKLIIFRKISKQSYNKLLLIQKEDLVLYKSLLHVFQKKILGKVTKKENS
jgi:O-antigen/teichoic acid export membrane protein